MKRSTWIVLALYGLLVISCTEIYSQETSRNTGENRFLDHDYLAGSNIGFQVTDIETGQVISAHQAEKLFIPASTLKLLVTLAGLDQFGADFKYQTKIKHSGFILEDGSLEGDLIISASGDPSFGSTRLETKYALNHVFESIHRLLIKNNIRCIDGNLLMDLGQPYYPVSGDWLWEDLGNYYGGGAWPFNFNENEYELVFEVPEIVGASTHLIEINPKIPFVKIQNEVLAGKASSGDQAYIFGGPYDYTKIVKGTLPAGSRRFTIKGSIPDPPYSFLKLLEEYLDSKGIYVEGTGYTKTGTPQPMVHLGTYSSPSLMTIVKACNSHSINLYSEAIGRLLLGKKGLNRLNTYPGPDEWSEVYSAYLPTGKCQVTDACGLAHTNQLSPESMNGFLLEMINRLGLAQVLDALPKNGEEGTVKNFLPGNAFAQRLWLKSGSIEGVINYAGIFQSAKNDKYYAFTIFTNHNTGNTASIRAGIRELLKQWILNME